MAKRTVSAIESAAIRALAEKIADDLFRDAMGDQAARLVHEGVDKKPGGGLCIGAAVDRIEAILRGE